MSNSYTMHYEVRGDT